MLGHSDTYHVSHIIGAAEATLHPADRIPFLKKMRDSFRGHNDDRKPWDRAIRKARKMLVNPRRFRDFPSLALR